MCEHTLQLSQLLRVTDRTRLLIDQLVRVVDQGLELFLDSFLFFALHATQHVQQLDLIFHPSELARLGYDLGRVLLRRQFAGQSLLFFLEDKLVHLVILSLE